MRGDIITIYLLREYDSFCEYSSIVCEFNDKAQAEEYMRTLESVIDESKRDIEKCRECPLSLEEYDDQKKADEYQCERKDAVQLDDGYFYCGGQSKLLYEVDRSYSIEETELR